ncbi:MAG: phospholipid carrier-dependent glycosyltransferase [Chloroflexi bacterium]|nr:phospholipid carrier-dependent glycosyltransferase [Chloroflexota bacterium]
MAQVSAAAQDKFWGRWINPLCFIVLLGLSFWLHAYNPVSRPRQWVHRSYAFAAAVHEQDWQHTYQQYHPGVTTMLFGGTPVYLNRLGANIGVNWLSPAPLSQNGVEVLTTTLGQAIGLTLVYGLIMLSVRALTNWPTALTAGGFLIFSPMMLANGRSVHVDITMTVFMLLSAILILLYQRDKKWLVLVLSGLAGGLALLSKSPSVFLIPYVGLVLLVDVGANSISEVRDKRIGLLDLLRRGLRGIGLPLVIWMISAASVFLLWPVMWIQPEFVLQEIVTAAAERQGAPHYNPYFYMGQVLFDRPPIHHYPVVMLFNMSFVTTIFAGAGLVLFGRRATRDQQIIGQSTYWLMVAYVVFFVIQMTLSAKTFPRYVLPAHGMIEIMAALGAIGLGNQIHLRFASGQAVFGAGAVLLQFALLLTYAPGYGVHHNHLLGGTRVANKVMLVQDQGEGLDEMMRHIYRIEPNLTETRVGVQHGLHGAARRYGAVGFTDQLAEADIDYVIFYSETTKRQHRTEKWQTRYNDLVGSARPVAVYLVEGAPLTVLYRSEPQNEPVRFYRAGWLGFIPLSYALLTGVATLLLRSPQPVAQARPRRVLGRRHPQLGRQMR